jgi:F0F1-type ATP synthase membrane subunit b/b'
LLRERRVTANRLIAYNLNYFRRVVGLSQQELGEPLGWSAASVSAAERSWDGKRVKKFDADEIVQISGLLGVPLAALFLPPEDHGTAIHYVLNRPDRESLDLAELLADVFPSSEGDSAAMDAYRRRVIAAGATKYGSDDNLQTAAKALAIAQAASVAIETARDEADNALGRARGAADGVLIKARRQAEQITGDARARAESLERDAQERYEQALGSLVQARADLERRIDDLRAFEREYRARLRTALEAQLRDFLAVETGRQDEAVAELVSRIEEPQGQRVSAVLLREDGTYNVVQLGDAENDDAQSQDARSPASQDDAS